MIKSIIIFGVLVSCCSHPNVQNKVRSIAANDSISTSKGELFCADKNKYFGIINSGQRIECIFFLENVGMEPVDILYYKASCNCTEVNLDKKRVYPEDTLKVKLIIDTKEKYPGLNSSTVIIKTNGKRTFYDLWANFEIKGK